MPIPVAGVVLAASGYLMMPLRAAERTVISARRPETKKGNAGIIHCRQRLATASSHLPQAGSSAPPGSELGANRRPLRSEVRAKSGDPDPCGETRVIPRDRLPEL